MRLSTRLAVAMVALVVVTAAATGFLIYRAVSETALPRALDRMDMHARLVATKLDGEVHGVRADVSTQGRALDAYVRASISGDASAEAEWRARLASRFVAELAVKPIYSQYRLIGIADGGREIVRVDRSEPGGAARVTPDAELQRRGDETYFKTAIEMPAGAVYVSPIELNRERGIVETPQVPTLRVASPVSTPDGKAFGILIINLDLRPLLASIRSTALPEGHVYVVNERGDYLLHPDRNREFAFELGKPIRVQDEFPEFAGHLPGDRSMPRVVRNLAGERFGFGWETIRPAGGSPITVIQALPYSQLLAAIVAVRNFSLLGGFAAVLGALLLALVLARSVIKPLLQITHAVEGFSGHETIVLPVKASGEIGVLARAFDRMATDVREKTASLEREIEERQRIFDTSLDLILVTDRKGNFLRVSPSSAAILGYRPNEMTGRSAIDFIYPDDLEPTRTEMRLARRGRVIRNFDTRYIHKDGRVVLLAWSGVWSEPEQRYFFIGRDMTEQKLAEEKFRLAVEASPSGIVMTNDLGTMILVNAETERLFGYKREELIGNSIDMLVPLDLRGRHARHRNDFLGRPETRGMGAGRDLNGMRKDGSEFPIEIGLNPIHTQQGLLVMSVIVDITESKKAQEQIRDSAQMARGIINTALDAFVQMDESGLITDWNSQAEAVFGWTRDEAVGRNLSETIIPERYRARHKEGLARFLRGGQSTILGTRLVIEAQRRDGQELKVELSVTGLYLRGGYLFNAFIRDLTDKIAAEEQFRQAQKMEAVGQLTGGVAHDFNNILTVITGTIEILGKSVADRPELAAIATMIEEAAERGAELTQHLLAFARKQPLQPHGTDINVLVLGAAKLLRPTLGEHVEIQSVLEDDTWPALVDANQLTTALLNLALNARDAMPNGGKLTFETSNIYLDEIYAKAHSELQPGPYIMIAVSDTGGGIPATIRDKVFEPFFTTKGVGKGTGLGLSMVYGFVKQSGGHIKIYSEEGHGTSIKIYLPRADEQAGAAPGTWNVAAPQGGDETIFVVEDDALVRKYVIAQLESLGYSCIAAANAADALARIDEGAQFDLLFTDIIMPGNMNGRQLADEVRKRRPGINVLFTSGYTENAIVHHGRLDPGVLLLAKPYRKSDLARMIRAACDGVPAEPGAPAFAVSQAG